MTTSTNPKGDITESSIAAFVTDFIRRVFLFGDEQKLTNDQSLLGTGIVDSTGILELIDLLEQRYGVKFQDHELVADNFDSISRMSRFMMDKLGRVGPAGH